MTLKDCDSLNLKDYVTIFSVALKSLKHISRSVEDILKKNCPVLFKIILQVQMARMEIDCNLKNVISGLSPCVLENLIKSLVYSLFENFLDIFSLVFYKHFVYGKGIKF